MKHIFWRFCGLLIFLVTAALFSLAVLVLWNILLPSIAGLPVINYWQAAGLFILARILFGGLGVHGSIGRGMGLDFIGQRNSLRDKWKSMSEDERDAFIKRHGGDFRHGHFQHLHTEDESKKPEAEKN